MLAPLVLIACLGDNAPLPEAEPPPPPRPALPPPAPPRPPRNRPPTIDSIALDPSAINTNSDVIAQVSATDPEGGIAQLSYAWAINDREILHVTTEALPRRFFVRGDEVRLRVTADDGDNQTQAEISVVVGNASPSFLTDPRSLTQIDGFKLEVIDPDEDEIAFRMEGAPRGMSVGKADGVLRYQGSADEPGGEYRVKVFAEDGSGGHAVWEFSLSVSAGSGVP
ncbi:MAG: hypothetical protein ACI8S6_003311 [Myxococcota bacterium]